MIDIKSKNGNQNAVETQGVTSEVIFFDQSHYSKQESEEAKGKEQPRIVCWLKLNIGGNSNDLQGA